MAQVPHSARLSCRIRPPGSGCPDPETRRMASSRLRSQLRVSYYNQDSAANRKRVCTFSPNVRQSLFKGLMRVASQSRPGGSMSEAAKYSGFPDSGVSTDVRNAQERFIHENLRRIFLQIYRIVGNVADAQDLTQETFIKALQRQDQIKDLEKATHWLSRIASNTAIDFLRRHGRMNFSQIEDVVEPLRTEPEH